MRDFTPNPRQRDAIEHLHGPMLVVAGAGTGKTTVIAARVASLLAHNHARADEIAVVAYNDDAAAHLTNRIAEHLALARIKVDPKQLRISTFHAACFSILQRAGKQFRVLDDKDLWIYLRRHLGELPLKRYLPPRAPGEFINSLLSFFSRCHDELITPAAYGEFVTGLSAGNQPLPRVLPDKKDAALSPEQKLERCREIAAVFTAVEQMLAADNLGTFGHMISGAVAVLRARLDILAQEQQRARFLLIDEFQDANVAQIELARLLAGDARNVFAVGDPDQAIYRFRGASSAAFVEFLHRFPGTRAVILEENQRSTSPILRSAHAVIAHNPEIDCGLTPALDFRRRPLTSARELRAADSGRLFFSEPVEVVLHDGKEQEAGDIAKSIRRLRDSGDRSHIAVIYRQHKHRSELVRELAAEGVPFVVEGVDALQTAEARDLISALAAVASLSNSEDVFRFSALPIFALDAAAVREELARSGRKASYFTLLSRVAGGQRVVLALESARAYAAAVEWNAGKICEFVIRQFGFDIASPVIAALREFIAQWHGRPITTTGTLQEFIEYMGLFRDASGTLALPAAPATDDAVRLMTVHAAKGLEFDRVFVLRVGRGSFPQNYREDFFEFPAALARLPEPLGKVLNEQEERRLFYVALTRARDVLSVYAKRGRAKADDMPPGFLRELTQPRDCQGSWIRRDARPYTATIHAAAPAAGVAAWLLSPPSARLPVRPLSATTIDAYDTCPLKFKLMVDWEIPGPGSAAMQYGSVMHRVLADFHRALQAGRTRTEGEVLQLFQDMMAAETFEDPLQARLYLTQGLGRLSEYLRVQQQSPAPEILHVENLFTTRIAGIVVRGRMDRVDRSHGALRIIDYKTGNAFTQDKADGSLQLTLYGLAARQMWGSAPGELLIYNLEDNTEIVTRRSQAAFADAEEKVAAVAAGIAAGNFDPNPEFHCGWCEYRDLCPATEQTLYTIASAAASRT
ncbi:MAG: ATP-dependent helicase [Terriglobales bacterium]